MVLGGLATLLLVGTTLAAGAQYSVVAGDTWESIAAAHDISVQQLADLNPVQAGDMINVPDSAPTTTPQAPTGALKCIGFGYEPLTNGAYNLTQDKAWLTRLQANGYNCVRDAAYGPNPTWAYPLYTLEKSMGFYVQLTADGTPSIGSYSTSEVAFATWAQANGVDEFAVGNEANKNTSTQKTLVTISCDVAAVYHGTIAYDTYENTSGYDDIATWAANKGCTSDFGINSYGGASYNIWAINKAIAAFGAGHVDVSETNCDIGNVSSCKSDAGLATEVSNDYVQLLKNYPGMRVNFFAWVGGGDGVQTYWGVINDPATLKAIGITQ